MRGNTVTIEVSLQRGKMAKSVPLYQYDYGQKLIFTNVELPSVYEVHFSNELHGESVTMIGDSTGVLIPDSLLTTGLPVYLWAFLHTDTDDGETEYTGVIPVIQRAQPSDVTPTPEEQSAITQAIAALNAGVETVENAVENIDTTIQTSLQEAKESGMFDGADGQDGQDGADGFTPTIDVTSISGGYQMAITNKSGTSLVNVMNGVNGARGQAGADGYTPVKDVDYFDGEDGEDGFSPTATISKDGSVATISITDKNGTTTATISDGEKGDTGDTGTTPAFSIGTVATGDPDSDAAVTMSGTQEAPVLNFSIPKGDPGDATIDDTAGAGDTDKVWSADKVVSELDDVKLEKADAIGITDDTAEAVKTITDGADGETMALTVGIEPVQDLHGYDNPWPAGGSRNIYSGTQTVTKDASANFVEVALPVPIPAGTYTMTAAVALASGVSAARASFRKSDKTAITYIQSLTSRSPDRSGGEVTLSEDCYYIYFYGTTDTSTKSAATFADIQIETGSATDYVPYSNICPISGWTGANVTRTGKNLFDISGTDTGKGFVSGKYLGSSGELITPSGSWNVSEYIKINSGTAYTLSGVNVNSAAVCFCEYDEDYNFLASHTNGNASVTFTSNASAKYVRISYRPATDTSAQFEAGSSASTFEAYTGNTYSITFPSSAGTVYGGTLTVNKDGTGTLAVNWNKLVVTNSDTLQASGKGDDSSYAIYKKTLSTANKAYQATPNDGDQYGLFSQGKWVKAPYGADRAYAYSKTEIRVSLLSFDPDVDMSTSAGRQAYFDNLASENIAVEVCYKLETPQTYELTALEVIETLKGINNIFADTGDILSVDYSADTKMYVDAVGEDKQEQIDLTRDMIAESDESTATEIHDIGELFICNNKLYKAIEAIAVGESIIEGSNVIETSVIEQFSNMPEMVLHTQIGKNGSVGLTMGVYSRAVVFVSGSNTQRTGIISILGGSAEAYTYNLIQALTNITITVSGMNVTLTNNAAGTEFIDVMKLYGDITISSL